MENLLRVGAKACKCHSPQKKQGRKVALPFGLSSFLPSLLLSEVPVMDSLKAARKILPTPVATAVLLYKGPSLLVVG